MSSAQLFSSHQEAHAVSDCILCRRVFAGSHQGVNKSHGFGWQIEIHISTPSKMCIRHSQYTAIRSPGHLDFRLSASLKQVDFIPGGRNDGNRFTQTPSIYGDYCRNPRSRGKMAEEFATRELASVACLYEPGLTDTWTYAQIL